MGHRKIKFRESDVRSLTFMQSVERMLNTVRGMLATTLAVCMVVAFFKLPLNWSGCWDLILWVTGNLP